MTAPFPARKPRDEEIDSYGLTHVGKVRKDNQDAFLMASVHKQLTIGATSLAPEHAAMLAANERLAFISMVADGVGGGVGGAEASVTALETAIEYVNHSMACYYRADESGESFIDELQKAAMRCHEAILAKHQASGLPGTMATTLTLFMGVWPWYYIMQVGDSRYYLFRDNVLTQLSRDQTIAQDLVDEGVLTRTAAFKTKFANVLSSALGADTAVPVVTRLQSQWGYTHLLCSDGLTKHVSDERIAERLRTMTTAKSACELLLQDALDGGGTDNITIIIGRAMPKGD